MRRRRRATDVGQAVPLLLAVVAVCCLVVVGVGRYGADLVDHGRAQVAADAAALAGVEGGSAAAAQLAAANGAILVSFEATGDDVTVVVEADGMRATARATNGP